MPKQDNSTFKHKAALRHEALRRLGKQQPVVMETHGGAGALFDACYAHLLAGVVFEKDAQKSAKLALQRPTWAVYEGDCVAALADGVGGHLAIDLLDLDPYGSPWEAMEAFFSSHRPFADRMMLAVNDGLREGLEMQHAWRIGALQQAVERHGNNLHPIYLDVCRELVEQKAAVGGYRLAHFGGYYCGLRGKMTHYLAELVRE